MVVCREYGKVLSGDNGRTTFPYSLLTTSKPYDPDIIYSLIPSQKVQHSLLREYTLNHTKDPNANEGIFPNYRILDFLGY